jgi:hypothetical protein
VILVDVNPTWQLPLKQGIVIKSIYMYKNNIMTNNKCKVIPVLCDLPREHGNRITQDRKSLSTGLINIKCTVKRNSKISKMKYWNRIPEPGMTISGFADNKKKNNIPDSEL